MSRIKNIPRTQRPMTDVERMIYKRRRELQMIELFMYAPDRKGKRPVFYDRFKILNRHLELRVEIELLMTINEKQQLPRAA